MSLLTAAFAQEMSGLLASFGLVLFDPYQPITHSEVDSKADQVCIVALSRRRSAQPETCQATVVVTPDHDDGRTQNDNLAALDLSPNMFKLPDDADSGFNTLLQAYLVLAVPTPENTSSPSKPASTIAPRWMLTTALHLPEEETKLV